jgi:hypothetical protein
MNSKQSGVLVCGIGATLTGLGAVAYHLFAPQVSQGVTCLLNEPESCQQTLAGHPVVEAYSYSELSFSSGWIIFFGFLAIAIFGIGLCAIQFARTQRRLWVWAMASLTLFYIATMYLLVDTTTIYVGTESGIAGHRTYNLYFGPGAILALLAITLAFFSTGPHDRHVAATAKPFL